MVILPIALAAMAANVMLVLGVANQIEEPNVVPEGFDASERSETVTGL